MGAVARGKLVPVKEGSFSIELMGDWDVSGRTALPTGTRFFGQLRIGEKRVYGLITQAVTPRGGDVHRLHGAVRRMEARARNRA